MSGLIIVESPAKVKTIKKYVGDEYLVAASKGHIRDLPKNQLSIDEEHDYTPHYEIMDDKRHIVNELKTLAGKVDVVYLAPDPDREGEAIAVHLKTIIEGTAKDIRRIEFNEITKTAILNALTHPRDIDYQLFDAQQARRILDRLVGYKVSPLLWKTIKFGISAGRVQSVALKLIVEREKERELFIPVEYWNIHALLEIDNTTLKVELYKVQDNKASLPNKEAVTTVEQLIKNKPWIVKTVVTKERIKAPYPPFNTSSLQQTASKRLGMSPKTTMSVAQKLYEGVDAGKFGHTALITYMRTDSLRIAEEARINARQYIIQHLGEEYYQPVYREPISKGPIQDAHESIRPVDVTITPEELKDYLPHEQYSLYKLIWQRHVAAQMQSAVFQDTTVTVECGETLWRIKGEVCTFPGYLKVWPYREDSVKLPILKAGDKLTLQKVISEQKYTQPPARYGDASLVKELEEQGIGRPSTYAAIITTLLSRHYVDKKDGKLVPTELGRVVASQLSQYFTNLMDVQFTAHMEESLDEIAHGKLSWISLIKEFMQGFNHALTMAINNSKNIKNITISAMECPECHKPLAIKFGRNSAFLGCTNYPNCKYTANFKRDDNGKIVIVDKEEKPALPVVGICPMCGGDLVVRESRHGSHFTACSNFPKCKYTQATSTGVSCPKCSKGTIVEKRTKKGRTFYSCDRYPDCDFTIWQKPISQSCPKCKSTYLLEKKSKNGSTYICPNKDCNYTAHGDTHEPN